MAGEVVLTGVRMVLLTGTLTTGTGGDSGDGDTTLF